MIGLKQAAIAVSALSRCLAMSVATKFDWEHCGGYRLPVIAHWIGPNQDRAGDPASPK
jgi:hypothetical protein